MLLNLTFYLTAINNLIMNPRTFISLLYCSVNTYGSLTDVSAIPSLGAEFPLPLDLPMQGTSCPVGRFLF